MKCPYCNSPDTKVTDSRDTDDGTSIRRRRQCLTCGRRFTTYETVEENQIRVIKKDGSRELFDRTKIRNGIIRACEKRNITSAQIDDVVNRIEKKIRNGLDQEVSSETIGRMVMDGLKELDEVAYIRFASVYRQFKDVQSFMEELQLLLDSQKKPEA